MHAPAEEIASASSDDDIAVIHASDPSSSAAAATPVPDAATAAYLQSLIDDPPTQAEMFRHLDAAIQEEADSFADPNPFLQSLVDHPPTMQEIVSQFGAATVSPENGSEGHSLLQTKARLVDAGGSNDAPRVLHAHSADVEDTRPQADMLTRLRKLPTPCRRPSVPVVCPHTDPLSGARGSQSVETQLRTSASGAPSCPPPSGKASSQTMPTALSLNDLVPAPAHVATSALLHIHTRLDDYLECMEPFGLHAFQTDMSCIPRLHPSTCKALADMPVWRSSHAQPVDAVELYVDGSYFESDSAAAWAVVAVVQAQGCRQWAGFMSGPLVSPGHGLHIGQTVNSPHTAELCALAYALATATKLANTHCCIYYDATAAAGIAEARSVSKHERALMHALFNLTHLARQEVRMLDFVHVPAHEGHAFNEAADAAAKAAAAGVFSRDPQALLFATAMRANAFNWVWWTTGPQVRDGALPGLHDSGLSMSGGSMLPRCHSLTHVPGIPTPVAKTHNQSPMSAAWNLRLCTYNCTTLTKECDRQCLATCFARDELDLVGLQETRTDPGPRFSQNAYTCFCAPADRGNLGCQLWVRTAAVVATGESRPVQFNVNNCVVAVREPRLLVVILPAGSQLLACVVAHAPLPETHPDEAQQWWSRLDSTMRQLPRSALPLLFIDANARFHHNYKEGTARTSAPCNVNAEAFQPFLTEHRLECCLSTADDGSPVVSWRSPHGNPAHLDYLAFPEELASGSVTVGRPRSFVDPVGFDHDPVQLNLSWTAEARSSACQWRWNRAKMRTPEGRLAIRGIMANCPAVGWCVHPDDHLQRINDYFFGQLQQQFPADLACSRRRHVSDELWAAVRQRRHARRLVHRNKQLWKQHLLQLLLNAWKHSCHPTRQKPPQPGQWNRKDTALRLANARLGKTIAVLCRCVHKLDQRYAAAHTREVLRESRKAGPAEMAAALRGVLKNGRRYKPPRITPALSRPHGLITDPADVQAALEASFAAPEHGVLRPLAQVANAGLPSSALPEEINLTRLFSMASLTEAFIQQKPNKAVGLSLLPAELYAADAIGAAVVHMPLILKGAAFGTLPMLWKGSQSVAIPKPNKPPGSLSA